MAVDEQVGEDKPMKLAASAISVIWPLKVFLGLKSRRQFVPSTDAPVLQAVGQVDWLVRKHAVNACS